ncbi:nickel pincer cofactor biosynthesis protein LarC [Leptolyngbya sp. CCY15150]|uniref:nickel pincer cofactor biosynthesis protein LarC n=1 Tax=Leptolyngbya sp. CCY15150 TaxID=2767772 RepID=UPI00194EBA4C|nr:nickel pincer cofactor biosynthesis protein LarC [Leptolyngbya sp. CCY15150]
MAKVAYLDCPTGLSGDMCLGALVDAGVPLQYLVEQLQRLGIGDEFQLRAEEANHNGQRATKVQVDLLKPPISAHDHDRPPNHTHDADHAHDHPHTHDHDHAHDHAHTHDADPTHDHGTRRLLEIEQMIQAAQLPNRPTQWSLAIFRQLAQAEGAVHGIPPEQVQFHEVGATDAIVDIVGTCLGLDWLKIDQLYCSALPTGGGTVWAAHGRIPIPAPAVLKLWELRHVPIYHNGIDREMVTPTGAAIATTLSLQFGPPPPMVLQRVGLGAGGRSLSIPNILRLWLGETPEEQTTVAPHVHTVPTRSPEAASLGSPHPKSLSQEGRGTLNPTSPSWGLGDDGQACQREMRLSPDSYPHPVSNPVPDLSTESLPGGSLEAIAVLETQIDDLNPQAIGYVFDALFAAGALDVFTQAIGMKKSRPGILLTVICKSYRLEDCETILFRETTTLGIRRSLCQRRALAREFHQVTLDGHLVHIKVARDEQGQILNAQPEYEDCVAVAQATTQPWHQVHQAAIAVWHNRQQL